MAAGSGLASTVPSGHEGEAVRIALVHLLQTRALNTAPRQRSAPRPPHARTSTRSSLQRPAGDRPRIATVVPSEAQIRGLE
jgi:hypothetical protein